MKKNDLLENESAIIRALELKEGKVLIIYCLKMTMPQWIPDEELTGYHPVDEKELWDRKGFVEEDIEAIKAMLPDVSKFKLQECLPVKEKDVLKIER